MKPAASSTAWAASGGALMLLALAAAAQDGGPGAGPLHDRAYASLPAHSSEHRFELQWGQSGLSTPGHFRSPQAAAVGPDGSVYVTDLGNMRVQKFDADGVYLASWGGQGSGAGQFKSPAGIAVGANHTVYVVDSQLDRVQAFGPDGTFVVQWGGRGSGPGQFLLPNGIAADPAGALYVADTGNQRIQAFSPNGTYLREFGSGAGLVSPVGVAIGASGSAFVSDPGSGSIKKFGPSGSLAADYDSSVGGSAVRAHGLHGDGRGGLYVADSLSDRVLHLDPRGTAVAAWGGEGIRAGQFKMPKDVASDSAGALYVVDTSGHRIQKFRVTAPAGEEPPPPPPAPAPASPAPAVAPPPPAPAPAPAPASPDPAAAVPGDLTKPTITPPADLLVEATGALTPVSVGLAVATDDRSGIKSLESNAPETFTLGISTVIWTAIDGSGNMAVATQTVTVRDTVPPTVGAAADVAVEAEDPERNRVELAPPPAADAVGVMSVESDAPELFPLGTTEVTWTVRDVVGNEAAVAQAVTVRDTTPPSIAAPPDVSVEAEGPLTMIPSLGEPDAADAVGVASVSSDAPEAFPIGATAVTWTATDSSSNTATAVQTVAVRDTIPPAITAPAGVIAEAASADPGPVEIGAPAVSDAQEFALSSDAPQVFPIGTTVVTWTATDLSNNTATAVQNVTVRDTVPPSLSLEGRIVGEAETPEGGPADLGVVGADDATGVARLANDAPESFPLGTTVVTWTASDRFNNTATAAQSVEIRDTVPPSIAAPPDIAVEAASAEGTAADPGSPAVSDAVRVGSVSSDAPAVFPIGTTAVTWTAADSSNNTATAVQNVAVRDTTPPSIAAPPDVSVEAEGPLTAIPSLGEPDAADAVGVASVSSDAPESFPIGSTAVVWTAADLHNNTATAVQNVTVRDTTPPSIAAPPDVSVEAEGPLTAIPSLGEPDAADAVGVASVSSDAPESFPIGSTAVTWTATDLHNNTATAVQNVTVRDTVPPAMTAPEGITVEATSADANIVELEGGGEAAASDLVGVASVRNDAPDAFPVGVTVVTWTAADESGNAASDSQAISVVDTTPPSLYAPRSVSAEATGPGGAPADLGEATASDLVGVVSIHNDAPPVLPIGPTAVTWIAADAAGNEQSAVQQVMVSDTTPPSIAAPPDVSVEAEGPLTAIPSLGEPDAADAVGVASVSSDAPDVFPLGTTTVTWTATDASNNTATAVQTVAVLDTIPPAITAPADAVLEASVPGGVPSSELGPPPAADAAGPVAVTGDAPPVLPLGRTAVVWTATDASNNTATAVQAVAVRDTTPPSIAAPPDVSVEAEAPLTAIPSLGEPDAADAVGVATVSSDAPDVFPLGTTTVTWTATDASNNTATAVQTVAVLDTIPPAITAPADAVLEASVPGGVPSSELGPPPAADAAGPVAVTGDAPPVLPLGRTAVVWTATDASNNTATAVQAVAVRDTTPPSIAAPPDVSVEAEAPLTAIPSLGEPDAADAVGVASVSSDAPEVFPLGTTTVTWTATDASNNTATAVQTVAVLDTIPPAITAPADAVLEASVPGGVPSSELGPPPAADAAGPVAVTGDAPPVLPLGRTAVVWTATDASNNTATAVQAVAVRDTTPPSIAAPPDVSVEAEAPLTAIPSLGEPDAADAVGVASVSSDAPEVFPLGTTTVTWTATDLSNNTATAVQAVAVLDTIPPAITAPADAVLEASVPGGVPSSELGPPPAADAAGPVAVTGDAPPVLPLGRTAVVWTATDASNNTATAVQAVAVRDTTPPSIAAPPDVSVEAEAPLTAIPSLGEPDAADAVGVASVSSDAPDVFPLGTTTVTWTATDLSNNTATAVQAVAVLDTIPPAITAPADAVLEASVPGGVPSSELGPPPAADAAGPVAVTGDAPPVLPLGRTAVVWTATDASNNTATAVQAVAVRDTTPPSIAAPPDVSVEAEAPLTAIPSLGEPDAADAVGVASVSSDAPDVFPLGTTTVTWTATDLSNNTATAVQTVAVLDTIPPAITAPADAVLEASVPGGVPSSELGPPPAADAAGPVAVTGDAPPVLPLGRTAVVWTATDASNNTATAVQAVAVRDTTPPSIAAPPDVSVEAEAPLTAIPSLGEPDAADAVGVATVSSDAPDVFPLGTTTVTWTATDLSNNTATAVQTVAVLDTIPPAITAPADAVLEASVPGGVPSSELGPPPAADAAGPVAVTGDAPPVLPLGRTAVVWTATDASNNTATAVQAVAVRDTTPPSIAAPPDVSVEAEAPLTAIPSLGEPDAADAVGVASVSSDAPEVFPLGTTTVTWTATDLSNNTATAVQTVAVLACGAPADGYNVVAGTAGADVLSGTAGPDVIFGLGGADVISAGAGDDCVLAGAGDDVVRGQSGDDRLHGGAGADILDGGPGAGDYCAPGRPVPDAGDLAAACES